MDSRVNATGLWRVSNGWVIIRVPTWTVLLLLWIQKSIGISSLIKPQCKKSAPTVLGKSILQKIEQLQTYAFWLDYFLFLFSTFISHCLGLIKQNMVISPDFI